MGTRAGTNGPSRDTPAAPTHSAWYQAAGRHRPAGRSGRYRRQQKAKSTKRSRPGGNMRHAARAGTSAAPGPLGLTEAGHCFFEKVGRAGEREPQMVGVGGREGQGSRRHHRHPVPCGVLGEGIAGAPDVDPDRETTARLVPLPAGQVTPQGRRQDLVAPPQLDERTLTVDAVTAPLPHRGRRTAPRTRATRPLGAPAGSEGHPGAPRRGHVQLPRT